MKNKRIAKLVMEKIEKGEVKMKPRWWFRIREGLLIGIWILLVLSSGAGGAAIIYLVESLQPQEIIKFGGLGVEVLVKGFPYLPLLAAVGLLMAEVGLISMIGDNYKVRTRVKLFALMILLLILSLALTAVRILLKLGY